MTAVRFMLKLFLAVAAVGLLPGCSPGVRIQNPEVVPVRAAGELQSLEFRSNLRVRNMARALQVLYEVVPLDAGGRPIRSRDGRFQNREGYVAAGKSFLVVEDDVLVEGARVRLPIAQLEADTQTRMRAARFRVLHPNGKVLAEAEVPVMLRSLDALAAGTLAPPAEKPGAEPSYDAEAPVEREAPRPRSARAPRDTGPPPGYAAAPRGGAPGAEEIPSADEELAEYQGRSGGRSGGEARRAAEDEPSDAERAAELRRRHASEVVPAEETGVTNEPAAIAEAPADAEEEAERAPRGEAVVTPVVVPAPVEAPAPAEAPAPKPQPAPEVVDARESRPAEPAVRPSPRVEPPRVEGEPEWFEYLVRRGDTLQRLAERFLGDSERWTEIYNLNESRLYSPHVLPIGTSLKIPRR